MVAHVSTEMEAAALKALHEHYGHTTLTPAAVRLALRAALEVMFADHEKSAEIAARLGYPKTAEVLRQKGRQGWRRQIAELIQRIWPGRLPEFHHEDGYCELIVRNGPDAPAEYIEVQSPRARRGLIGALAALAEPTTGELIANSSIGQAIKEMKEDPEGHLRRLEEELFKGRG